MNAFGLALVWVSLQVSVLCLVAMAVYLIARRGSPIAGAAATLSGLLLVVLLSAVALSPWPHWSYGEDSTVTEENFTAAASTVPAGDAGSVVDVNSPALAATNPEVGSWYSAESLRQFWIALQETPVTVEAVEQTATLNWSGWVAVVFLTGALVAIVRLVLGLLTVARHRLRSRAIDDAPILELLDVLCAELGCVKSIVLRESSELVSAATIGWRRPLILLPPEWREWTSAERRSVIAHEIAHIRHNDFLFWLFAQSGLLLHFYHPLVHWLANRLRLEQELAADATAAAHSGGARPYLKTLAELALRQADRPVAWPARTFLPTKGTLMRRVEMLRDTGLVRGTASWRRGFAVATLLGAAVLLSGIRPPEGGLAAAADDEISNTELAQADKPKRKARKERKKLQETAAAEKESGATFDLTYVPAATQMMVGVRPAAMSEVEGFKPLIAMVEQNVSPEKTGIEFNQFEQFLLMAIPPGEGGDPFSRQPVISLKTTKRLSFEKFITWMAGGEDRQAKESGGRNYVIGHGGKAYYSPDDRSLIYGSEDLIRRVIELTKDGATAPSWNEKFQTVANSQMCYVLDMNAARSMIARQTVRGGRNPFSSMDVFSPLWEKTSVTVAGIQFGSESRAVLSTWCKNKEDAVQVQRTMQSLIPLAQNMMAANKAQLSRMPKDMRGQVSSVIAFVDKLLSDIKVDTVSTDAGAQVNVSVETEAATIPLMVGLTLPAIQSARTAARRTQSMNNLKQIGLAMHNYHATYKKFPAAVMTAKDGKTKYSWRVALLPFIDQLALYESYKLTEPWDSKDNLKVLAQMPNVYRHPNEDSGTTNSAYYALIGESTAWGDGNEAIGLRDIVDGSSNTALVFDARRAIPWTKPQDIAYSADKDVPKLGGYEPGGFNVLLGDGAVRYFSNQVAEKTLRSVITRNGKEIIDWGKLGPQPGGQRSLGQ
ncbi:MAG: DUF1559 family PulG-like putative transporter [Planctomycetales bacterium]